MRPDIVDPALHESLDDPISPAAAALQRTSSSAGYSALEMPGDVFNDAHELPACTSMSSRIADSQWGSEKDSEMSSISSKSALWQNKLREASQPFASVAMSACAKQAQDLTPRDWLFVDRELATSMQASSNEIDLRLLLLDHRACAKQFYCRSLMILAW